MTPLWTLTPSEGGEISIKLPSDNSPASKDMVLSEIGVSSLKLDSHGKIKLYEGLGNWKPIIDTKKSNVYFGMKAKEMGKEITLVFKKNI